MGGCCHPMGCGVLLPWDTTEGHEKGMGRQLSPAARAASHGEQTAPSQPAAARCGCSLVRCSAKEGQPFLHAQPRCHGHHTQVSHSHG